MTDDLFNQEPLFESGGDLAGALEALMLASGEVLDLAKLRELLGLGEGSIRQGMEILSARLQPPHGARLLEVGGGWRLATAPEYSDLVGKLVTTIRSGKLTPAQIETLAIIAYRQPVTGPEINDLRGITASTNQLKSLLERELVEIVGRKSVVGRPMMYVTTQKFLLHFGLQSLSDLPHLGDFGEGNLEAQALAQLEQPMPEGSLFDGEHEVAAIPPISPLEESEEALDPLDE